MFILFILFFTPGMSIDSHPYRSSPSMEYPSMGYLASPYYPKWKSSPRRGDMPGYQLLELYPGMHAVKPQPAAAYQVRYSFWYSSRIYTLVRYFLVCMHYQDMSNRSKLKTGLLLFKTGLFGSLNWWGRGFWTENVDSLSSYLQNYFKLLYTISL